MAGNGTIGLTAVPVDLTGEDFLALTFQVRNASARIMATSDLNAPDVDNGIVYSLTQGESSATDLAGIFPGVSPIRRIWAWNDVGGEQAQLFRSWS